MNYFIAIEGNDGAGKSILIQLLKEKLDKDKFLFVKDPGQTVIGEKIRDILLDKNNSSMHPVTELMLFAASRAQMVNEVIKPTLQTKHVISDRFVLSTLVYQDGVKTHGNIREVLEFGLKDIQPDLTILLDIDPYISFQRIQKYRKLDRMENCGIEVFIKRREMYLEYSKVLNNVKVIDASKSCQEVFDEVYSLVKNLVKID